MDAEEKAKEEREAEEALKQEDENRYLAAQKRKEDMMKDIDNSAAQVRAQRGDAVMLAQTAPATNKTALVETQGVSKYLKAALKKEPRLELDFVHPDDNTVEPNSPLAVIGSAPPNFVQLRDDAGAAAATATTDAAATTAATPAAADAAATTTTPATTDAAATTTADAATAAATPAATPAATDAAATTTATPAATTAAPAATTTAPAAVANTTAPATVANVTAPVANTTNATKAANATASATPLVEEQKAIKELKEQEEAEHELKAKAEPNSPHDMMPYFNATRPEQAKKHPQEADAKPFFARPPKDRTHYEKPEGLTWKNRYP